MATVTSLGFSIFSRYNGRGVREARRDLDSLSRKMRVVSNIGAPVVAASAAAVPALGAITAAAGTMAAGLTAAGAGAAAMGAVAVPAIVDIADALKLQEQAANGSEAAQEKLNKQLAEMSPAARTLMKDWSGLTKEYREWSRSLEPDVLPVFSKGIDLVRGSFKSLNPLVKASSGAFSDLIDDLDKSLDHPFWSEFGSRVTRLAPTAIGSLGRTGGHLAAGVAGVIKAFMPSAPGMLAFVEKIAKGFAEWGRGLEESPGFREFMEYVGRTAPVLLDLLDSIGPALANILRGLAPIGPAALRVATGFLDLIAAAPPEVLTAIAVGIGAIGIAVKGAALVSTLMAIANPIGAVVLGVGALAAGLVIAYGESETFREVVNGVFDSVKASAGEFFDGVKSGFSDLVSSEDIDNFLSDIRAIGKAFEALEIPIGFVADKLGQLDAKSRQVTGGTGLWEGFGQGVGQALGQIGMMAGVAASALAFMAEESRVAWFLAMTIISAIGQGFILLGQMIWNGLKFLFYDPGLGGLFWSLIFQPIVDGFTWLYNTLVGNSIVPELVTALLSWFTFLFVTGRATIFNMVNSIVGFFTNLKNRTIERLVQLKEGAVARFNSLRQSIVSSALSLVGAGISAFNRFRDRSIEAFRVAQVGIGRQWSRLRAKAAAPIRYVVDVVYMGGIRKVWNAVARHTGLKSLPGVSFGRPGGRGRGGLARGGILPGTSTWQMGDDQLRPMRRGEGVSVSELMRDPFERARLLRLNKAAMMGKGALERERERLDRGGNPHTPAVTDPKKLGFARGGIVGAVGRFLKGIKNYFVNSDFAKSLKRAFAPMTGSVSRSFGGYHRAAVGKMVAAARKKLLSYADFFRYGLAGFGSLENVPAGLRRGANFVRRTVGRPYQWGGGGPLFDCSGYMAGIQNAIMNRNPPLHYGRLYSTFSFQGRRAPRGWVRGLRSPFMVGITNAGVGHMAGTLLGVNVESAGSKGTVAGRRARGYNHPMFYGRYGFAPVARRRFGGDLRPYESAYVGEAGRELFTAGAEGGHVTPHRDLPEQGRGDHYVTINVNVPPTADKAGVGKAVYEALVEYERRSGRKLSRA